MPVHPKNEPRLLARPANLAETIIRVQTRILDITPEKVNPKNAAKRKSPIELET